MEDKIKQIRTQRILCPCCAENHREYHSMICAVNESGDIIIRCRKCKTDVNVSERLRQNKLNKAI